MAKSFVMARVAGNKIGSRSEEGEHVELDRRRRRTATRSDSP